MKCSDIMKTDVECCNAKESVQGVAERMRSRNIGFVPICDDSGALVGTLTDRDLAIRVLGEHRQPDKTKASDVMSSNLICCKPEDKLDVAEQLMSKHKVSRILCVDNRNHPVGVISLSDIASREKGGKASALLRSVSQREARP